MSDERTGFGGAEQSVRVVLGDEQPVFLSGLVQLLDMQAPGVVVVANVTTPGDVEALVARERPDVVVLDTQMFGTARSESVRRLLALSPTTKIVVLTASRDPHDLYGALKDGAVGYLTKDRGLEDIVGALLAVVRGHVVMSAPLIGHLLSDLQVAEAGGLSPRERHLLSRIAAGDTNREIAESLRVSDRTVRRHLAGLYGKLHLADRREAAVYAAEHDLAPTDRPLPARPGPGRTKR